MDHGSATVPQVLGQTEMPVNSIPPSNVQKSPAFAESSLSEDASPVLTNFGGKEMVRRRASQSGSWKESKPGWSPELSPASPPRPGNLTETYTSSHPVEQRNLHSNMQGLSESSTVSKTVILSSVMSNRRRSEAAEGSFTCAAASSPLSPTIGSGSKTADNERTQISKTARVPAVFKPPTRPVREADLSGTRHAQPGQKDVAAQPIECVLKSDSNSNSVTMSRENPRKSFKKMEPAEVSEAVSVRAMSSCPLFRHVPDGAVWSSHFLEWRAMTIS